jgi:hypothetical protein
MATRLLRYDPAQMMDQLGAGFLVAAAGMFLLLVIVAGAAIMFFDGRGRREDEAVWLQTRIARRLERETALDGTAVVPVVQAAPRKDAPVVVALHGQVPTEAAHRAVLEAIADEIDRSRPALHVEDVHVQDRLRQVPTAA